MTFSTTDNRESYDGTGFQTLFPFTKLFYANADLQVTLVDANGVETLQVLDTDYTVTGAGAAPGGDVTMIVPPALTEKLIILRVVDNSQESDYVNPGGMDLEIIEKDFDLSAMQSQQNTEELDRALRVPKGSPLSGSQLEIPDPDISGNRSKVVGTKADGTGFDLVENVPVGTTPAVIDPGDASRPMRANATEDGIEASDTIKVAQLSEDVASGGVTVPPLNYKVDSGAADAYVVTLGKAPPSYQTGMEVSFLPSNANTGASTLNVNVLGVKNILLVNGAALVGGEIQINSVVVVKYDGTQFRLLNPAFERNPRNLIINPDGEIAQRGASGTAAFTAATIPLNSNDTYLFDRWVLLSDGNDRADVSQEATIIPAGSRLTMKFDVETVGGTSEKFGILQILEASEIIKLRGRNVSISFQARTTGGVVENLRAAIVEWTGAVDAPTSDIVSAWEAEGTDPTLIGSWAYLNTPSNLALSNAFQTFKVEGETVGGSANNLAVFIWVDDTDLVATDVFYIAQVKLEQAETATGFESRGLEEEWSLCQRFYEKSWDAAQAPGSTDDAGRHQVNIANTTSHSQTTVFNTRKRGIPTFTPYDDAGNSGRVTQGATDNQTTFTINYEGEHGAWVLWTGGAITSMSFQFTADSEL